MPDLVLERVARFARSAPQQLALADRRRAITYGELVERAYALARRLRGRGVLRDSIVAICCAPGPELVIAQLAVMEAGGAFLPLDPSYPRGRLELMLQDSGAALLIDEGSALPAGEVLSLSAALTPLTVEESRGLPRHWAAPAPSDLAYVLYTSGSTGTPKGVLVEHASLLNYVLWDVEYFELGPRDRVSQVIAPSFDMSLWEIWPALAAGASLHFADRADYGRPGALFRWLAQEAVTLCILPTPLCEALLKEAEQGPEIPPQLALRRMLVAGDRLRVYPRPALPFTVYNLYGPTEATMNVTCGEVPPSPQAQSVPPHIGGPIANAQLYVLDEQQRAVASGQPGELFIGGPGLARGYHARPELTAERFVQSPFDPAARLYRTGDLVRERPDGNYDFLGRIDHQVKIRGHRIELGEVEAVLAAHPELRSVVVVRAPDEQSLLAYVVPARADQPPGLASLRDFAAGHLPSYMVPNRFVVLPALPLTPNGKIDRAGLPLPRGSADDGGEAGSNTLAQRVRRIWSDALGVRDVADADDFFELGGHSIAAISALARLERELGLHAGLQDLVEAPTLAAFRLRLEQRGNALGSEALPQAQPSPLDLHEPFALTDVQHAYWIGRQGAFELGRVSAHLYFELEGELHLGRLEQALRRVIAHHPMLRAVIRDDGKQQILSEVPDYTIRAYDLRLATPSALDEHLKRVRSELSHQVLPTGRWPLFDVRATRLTRNAVRLHLSFDALIVDAQSLFRIFDEWHRLYVDPERRLLPSHTSFRDYVIAWHAREGSTAYAAARAYWRARIATLPSGPELPLAVDPRKIDRPRFKRRRFVLNAAGWRTLRSQAHRAGVTETVALLAAYADVLAAFSKTHRFCIDLTLFNRLALCPDVEAIVGDFTSITLLEVDATAGRTLEERAARLQRQLWQDLDHRIYGGVQVLRDCASQRGRMLAPVVFTSELGLEGMGRDTAALERFGREIMAVTQTPQVWIDLQVVERGGELHAYWDAVESLFPEGVLDAMFQAFTSKLERLARHDAAWQDECWLAIQADGAKRARPLPDSPPELLHTAFVRTALEHPERVAVIANGISTTYGTLLSHARMIADAIGPSAEGAEPLVAVMLQKGASQIAAVLGTLMAGAAYVPIEAAWPRERKQELLARSEVAVVLTSQGLASELALPSGVRSISVQDVLREGRELPLDAAPQRDPSALAYVIYTSGSTGVPKGVMIEHRAAHNTVREINARFEVTERDRVLGVSALGFDLSVYDVFGPLSEGAALVLPDAALLKDPKHLRACIAEHGVTIWNSVPALLELLIDALSPTHAKGLRSLRLVLMSGDWIAVTLPDRFRGLVPDASLVSLGGATEASIWSIVRPIGEVDPSWRSIPYGRALARQTVEVLDAQGNARPPWVSGELYIGGEGLARGYLGDPERTAGSFVTRTATGERLYRTGDLGRLLPSGEIEFLGREDGQVKINGHRIELGEVEAALARHPGVRACAVAAPGGTHRRLVAGVVPIAQVTVAALRAHLCACLPEAMVPSRIALLAELPLSHNGKVDRVALAPLCEPDTGTNVVGPAGELENDVVAVWSEILERPAGEIDAASNFFDSGGDSVAAIRLRARLEERFGVELAVVAVFEHATIQKQAAFLAAARVGDGPDPAADKVRGRGERRRQALLRQRGTSNHGP